MARLIAAILPLLLLTAGGAAQADPLRLGDALGIPERLSLSLQQRVRYEFLDEQFQVGWRGRADLLVLRTLLLAKLHVVDGADFGAEFADSRAYLVSDDQPINNTSVDSVELLQAYAEFSRPWPFTGKATLRAGRMTMDIGSRRLVARNRFRNTINSFTGLDWRWNVDDDTELRGFFVLPVNRLPSKATELRHNEVKWDEESFDVMFGGAHAGTRLPWGDRGEFSFFVLDEHDAPHQPTRNRHLYTPGLRTLRTPATGAFDYDLESVLQLGTTRASTTGTRDLDVFAHFHHAEVGYTFDAPWKPRIALQYDYASGDEKPGNGKYQRFDTLYGARRFDFGPTGSYGAFARANVNTPGLRAQVVPTPTVDFFTAFRGYWLASDRDAWTTSGDVDATGRSGSFIGSQLEFRLRWNPLPGNVQLESGYAHLFSGKFMKQAPNATYRGDVNYFYTQLSFDL